MNAQARRGVISSGGFVLVASFWSCGDPSLPIARGAAALHWDISLSGKQAPECVPGPHWSNVPVWPNDTPSVTANQVSSGPVENGHDGVTVTCRVAPQGEQFAVSGEIYATGSDTDGHPKMTQVAVRAVIGHEQDGAQGTLYIADEKSDLAFSSDTTIIPPKPGCLFSVNSADDSQLAVAPGRIWARVTCPHIQDNRNRAKQECQISEGYILLEGCLRD
jgi:hypothetical protein